MNPKIICVHLLNDYSGSPLVLSQVIQGFLKEEYDVTIYTNQTEGFLSNIDNADYKLFNYYWSNKRWKTMFRFFWCQLLLFFRMWQYRKQDVTFYINTVLPFGVALAGKLMGKQVIYHVHETSVNPPIFKKSLFNTADYTATKAIYVSEYLREQESLKSKPCTTIYNALPQAFTDISSNFKKKEDATFNILMLCSLKRYKGINEFIELATSLPSYQFYLILNAKSKDIQEYFKDLSIPTNILWYPAQKNVHAFYQQADVVLNMSHPEMWVETFGMTALEAMSYGLPVIVPPVGGIAEVVEHGINGFHQDCRNIEEFSQRLQSLANNYPLYQEISKNAKLRAEAFSLENMSKQINTLIGTNASVSNVEKITNTANILPSTNTTNN